MIKLALRNPYAIIVTALATVVLGVTSFQEMPADLLPIFKTPAVQIVTFYPGMPPEVMERDIMSRLERWTGQSVGIEHQEAKAMLGVCVVKDFFREGISLDTAMSQVTSYAVSDMFYLPPGTIPPMVMPFDPTASVPLCLVSVSSPSMNEKELYDIAYFELRNRLQSIQGVIAPAVYGGRLRRILAYVDRERLEARNLSPMDVVRALREQNVFIPAGNMKAGNIDYQIFANSMPTRVEELNDMPIAVRQGAPVLIRDVADVRDSSQIQTNIVRVNGRRQVYIPIYRQPGATTIEIVNSIRRNLERILQRLREMDPRAGDLAIEVVLDQSVYVRNSLKALQIEGLLGAAFAALAGINVEDVMKNLVTATNSSIGFDPAFWIDERNGNHYFIGAQYAEDDLVSVETLRDIPVKGANGDSPMSLRTLVKMSRKTGPAVVNHRNITRVIDVYASVLPGKDIGTVVSGIERRLKSSPQLQPVLRQSDRGLYFEVSGAEFAGAGYSYVLAGEVATMRESFDQFLQGFLLAVILVYLVLVLQFRSFLDPFIVLLTVPMGLIGVAVMLFVSNTQLSIMAAMGIIMMVGLVVAYSILLVDFANRRLAQGALLNDAICDAAQVRLRPILMTSLAAVFALTPMALGGQGAEANVPLARAIIGGVLSAASLSLLVVPCLYITLKRKQPAETV